MEEHECLEYECLECGELIEKEDLVRRDDEDTCPQCGSSNVISVLDE